MESPTFQCFHERCWLDNNRYNDTFLLSILSTIYRLSKMVSGNYSLELKIWKKFIPFGKRKRTTRGSPPAKLVAWS